MTADLLRVAAEIATAGAERLAADLAEPVTASPPTPVTLDQAVPGDAVVARSVVSGTTSGDILTIVSAADLGAPAGDGPADLHLADPLLAGASAALGSLLGPVAVGPAEAVVAFDPAALPPGAALLRSEITVAGAAPVPVVWVFSPEIATAPAQEGPATAAERPAPEEGDVTVAAASFPELGHGAPPAGMRDLSVLADVAMDVTVELGRARLRVRDLLGLQTGSIVELDRSAGAAVDVLVNGTLVAQGDVVVIDDDLGVRITEVVEAP